MKCPQTLTTNRLTTAHGVTVGSECLREKCAWWYKDGARCCHLDICLTLNTIDLQLQEICERKGG